MKKNPQDRSRRHSSSRSQGRMAATLHRGHVPIHRRNCAPHQNARGRQPMKPGSSWPLEITHQTLDIAFRGGRPGYPSAAPALDATDDPEGQFERPIRSYSRPLALEAASGQKRASGPPSGANPLSPPPATPEAPQNGLKIAPEPADIEPESPLDRKEGETPP